MFKQQNGTACGPNMFLQLKLGLPITEFRFHSYTPAIKTGKIMFNLLAQPPKTLTETKFARETSRSGDAASQRRDGVARYVCLTPSSLES